MTNRLIYSTIWSKRGRGGGCKFLDQVGVAINGIDQSPQFTLNYYQGGGAHPTAPSKSTNALCP